MPFWNWCHSFPLLWHRLRNIKLLLYRWLLFICLTDDWSFLFLHNDLKIFLIIFLLKIFLTILVLLLLNGLVIDFRLFFWFQRLSTIINRFWLWCWLFNRLIILFFIFKPFFTFLLFVISLSNFFQIYIFFRFTVTFRGPIGSSIVQWW